MKFASPKRSAVVRRNGVAPDEVEALGEPPPERLGYAIGGLLERRAHREQRDGREPVRHGVDDERQRAGDLEESAAERRAGQPDDRVPPGLGAGGSRELLRGDDGAERADLSRGEHRRAEALDERRDRQLPEREALERDHRRQRGHHRRADAVGRDHQPSPAEPVGQDARRQCEQRRRQRPGERHEAGLGRRVCEREHQQGVGDRRRLRAGVRKQLSGLEQHEVAVAAERADAS